MKKFEELLTKNICEAANRIMITEEFLAKTPNLQVNPGEGFVDIDGKQVGISVVGNYLEKEKEWFWAWADSVVPDQLKGYAFRLKQIGEEQDVEELKTERLSLHDDGTELMMVCSSLLEGITFIRVGHEMGEIVMFINGMQFNYDKPLPPKRIAAIISRVAEVSTVKDHRLMIRSFYEQQGITFEEDDREITAVFDGEKKMRALIDPEGKFTQFIFA